MGRHFEIVVDVADLITAGHLHNFSLVNTSSFAY